MENIIYLVKNRLANRFVAIMSFETDELMKARLSDPKAQFNYDELEIYKVGSYNVCNGTLSTIPPESILIPRPESVTVDSVAVEAK